MPIYVKFCKWGLGIYQYHRDIHYHNTRHSTDPRMPNTNFDILRTSFLYQDKKLWASLDDRPKGLKN